MSVATTSPASTSGASTDGASTGGGTGFGQILSDLDSTLVAVQKNDWVTAGLDGAATALDVVGSNPLSGLVNAGFGFLTGLVSFLEAPLKTLSGDSGAVTSSSQGLHGAGQTVSSLAGSYSDAGTKETSGWSGPAASGYQNTASELADGLRTIAKASSGVSSAIEGAGKVVGEAQQIITQLIGQATTEINSIMSEALAAAPATGGASVAAAIPHAVGVAANYGQQIAGKMGALLSSSQNLASLLLVIVRALEAADKAMQQIGGKAGQSSGTSTSPSSASTSSPSSASTSSASTSSATTSSPSSSSTSSGSPSTASTSADSSPGSSSSASPSSGSTGAKGIGFWIGTPPSETESGGNHPAPDGTTDQHPHHRHHHGHHHSGHEHQAPDVGQVG